MNLMARDSVSSMPDQASRTGASSRYAGIDAMRGIAILMVIGIHSLQQPLISGRCGRLAATMRPDFPVCIRIPHRAFRAGSALEAAEGDSGPLRDRVCRGLHLHGTA
jgi:hypothetical protein